MKQSTPNPGSRNSGVFSAGLLSSKTLAARTSNQMTACFGRTTRRFLIIVLLFLAAGIALADLQFSNPSNVTDAGALELVGATGVTTAVVSGTTYVFVAGQTDDGVSVFSLAANGTLTNVFNTTDAGALELDGAYRMTTAVVGGTTYLFVAGSVDDGVSVFSVAAGGALTNVSSGGNITDDVTLELDGASGVASALSGGNPYLFVSGFDDDGLSVFSIGATGALTNVATGGNVTDAGALELDGARGVTTAIVGGNTYVFVAGSLDDGVSEFRAAPDGSLTSVANVNDAGALELDGAESVATSVVGGTTYLFVASSVDDGVSVFSVAVNGTLTNVFNVTDNATLKLDGAFDLTTAVYGGTTYLYVAGLVDDGVSVFSIAANGTLTSVANVADDPLTLELNGAAGIAAAAVSNKTYLIAAGQADDGVSVLNQTVPSGQLWFPVGGNSADTSVGHVNNDGSNATLLLPTLPEAQSSIGIDLPAGYYFTVSTDKLFIESHRISDNVKVEEIQIGNPATGPASQDIVNALVVDPYNEIIYVGLWGQDIAHTGIVKVTYDPLTGDLNNNATYGTGVTYDGDTVYLITNTGTGGKVNDIRYLALDTNGTAALTDDVIYYSDTNNGSAFFNGPTNQIYSVNVNTGATVQLSSNSNVVGGFPTNYSQGYIGPVTFNKADSFIYFMTHETSTNAAHLWRMPVAGGLATEMTAPAGHTFSLGDIPTGGLTFDPVTEQLYITVQSNIPQGFTVDEVIQVQLNAAGTAISSVVDFYPLSELVGHAPDPNAHVAGNDYDELPTFTKTDVGTAAVEQGSAVDVISSPSITDSDGDHLASAKVQISGSFTGSGDQLFVLDGVTEKTSGTFGATGITIAQTNDGGGNLTLTFTGYATPAQYQTVLDAVRFRSTGDNPNNYGANVTRTINWTVSDGAQNVPFGGQNTAITTLNITAVNDNPVNNLPASPSINEDVQTAITGLSITDADADPANQDITVTLSVINGTLNVLTNVANGILALDITGGAQNSNTITITAPQNLINTTIAGSGLRYLGNANYNGSETLHIVTNDNSHTPGPAQTDTDDLSVTVVSVNDAPAGTDNTKTILEDASYTFAAVDFGFSDPQDAAGPSGANGFLAVKFTTLPAGTLLDNGAPVGVGGSVLVTHINSSQLVYTPTLNGNGNGFGNFTFQVQDNGGTSPGVDLDPSANNFTINVTAVDDAPVNTVPGAQSVAESANLSIPSLQVNDVDAGSANITVTLGVLHGTVTVATNVAGGLVAGDVSGNGTANVTINASQTKINNTFAAASGVVYKSGLYQGSETLTMVSDDNGNTGINGPLNDTDMVTITVTAPPVDYAEPSSNCGVGNDPCFSSIQTAIDNVLAGGTVIVIGGTFSESVNLNKSATVNINGATTVNGFAVSAGTLNASNGGSFALTLASGNLSVSGGGFNAGTGTVVFSGTGAQTSNNTSAFNNLTINNSGGSVTLASNAVVNSLLTLSSDLNTSTFTLIMPNTGSSAGTADVVGNVQRTGVTADPGGNTLSYGNPNNTIRITAGLTPGSITVNLVKSAPATYATAVQRRYTITPSTVVGYTTTVRLHYLDSELNGNSEPALGLRRFRTGDSHWVAAPPPPGVPTRDPAPTANWVEATGVLAPDLPTQWTFSSELPTATGGVVTGRIVDNNGAAVEGAVVNLTGTQNRKFITDANGVYRFENVETTGFYTVTPSRVNYSFNPASRSFSQIGESTEAAFGAALSSSGFVNPLDTPEYFVRQHYVDFLGREPDEAGFNFWSDQILSCGGDQLCVARKRENVSAAYFLSIEFQRTGGLVDGLYRASYGVRPDFAQFMPDTRTVGLGVQVGKEGWEGVLEANKVAFMNAFVNRAAFHQVYDNMDNSLFVDTLIGHTGVSFTAGERDALVSGLGTGTMTRAEALRSIAENNRFADAKFNDAFVMMEYFGYLRRNPDAGGFAFWLAKLNEFGGNFEQAEMVKAFIVSGEFRDRFPR